MYEPNDEPQPIDLAAIRADALALTERLAPETSRVARDALVLLVDDVAPLVAACERVCAAWRGVAESQRGHDLELAAALEALCRTYGR